MDTERIDYMDNTDVAVEAMRIDLHKQIDQKVASYRQWFDSRLERLEEEYLTREYDPVKAMQRKANRLRELPRVPFRILTREDFRKVLLAHDAVMLAASLQQKLAEPHDEKIMVRQKVWDSDVLWATFVMDLRKLRDYRPLAMTLLVLVMPERGQSDRTIVI
jgi:hypothetical protein